MRKSRSAARQPRHWLGRFKARWLACNGRQILAIGLFAAGAGAAFSPTGHDLDTKTISQSVNVSAAGQTHSNSGTSFVDANPPPMRRLAASKSAATEVRPLREGTGRPLADPVIEVWDDTRMAQHRKEGEETAATYTSPARWVTRFTSRSTKRISLIEVEFLNHEGLTSDGTQWLSRWKVYDIHAGSRVPTPFLLVQRADSGHLPVCSGVEGFPGRRDLMLIEQDGAGNYRLLYDEFGIASYFIAMGKGQYQVHNGPVIDGVRLIEEAKK